MTRQAVTWQMLRGPKHRLRTKGTDLRMAAWLLGSMLHLNSEQLSHIGTSVFSEQPGIVPGLSLN